MSLRTQLPTGPLPALRKVATRTEAQRGGSAVTARGGKVPPNWEKTLRSSLKQHWKAYRRALKRCRHKLSEKTVHGSRIETRRLLSLVDLLTAFLDRGELKKTRRQLKRHLDLFDPLRDTHVQQLLLDECRQRFPEIKPLRRMLAARQERCLEHAALDLPEIGTHGISVTIEELCRQLKLAGKSATKRTRDRTVILKAVQKAFETVVRFQRAMDPGRVETIHRTRIAFKQFRYMLEALKPLLSELSAQQLEAMHKLQSLMGDVQDTEVFLARIDKWTARKPGLDAAVTRLRPWLVRRLERQIATAIRASRQVDGFWPLPRIARPPAAPASSLENSRSLVA